MHPWRRIFVPLSLLFVCLLLDGVISALFQPQLSFNPGYMTPRLFVLAFLLCAFYLPTKQLVTLSIVFGLIYDSYYTGVLGIYAAYLTITVFAISKIRDIFFPNIAIIGMVGIVVLTFFELFVYFTYRAIGFVQMEMVEFFAQRLGPTLLLNGILFIVLYYPLKKVILQIFIEEK